MSDSEKWFDGLFVSLFIGHIVTSITLVLIRRYLEGREEEFKKFSKKQKALTYLGIYSYPPKDPSEKQIHPLFTGLTERLFFTIIIAYNISGAAVAMIGWITLKMVTSGEYRRRRAEEQEQSPLGFEFAGLIGNLFSMFFALVGGLTCR